MTKELSEKELQQRQEAAKTHGIYSIRDRGQEAMTPTQRSKRVELSEQFETKAGVIDAMKDQAVDTLILAQIAQSYCVSQHQQGKPLDRIPLLRNLPAFWNSAGRALKNYLDVMPDDSIVLDLSAHVQRAMSEGGNDS